MPEKKKDCPKNEQLAEKRNLEGNCEILRAVFQQGALSSDIPASWKGVYLFYNLPNTILWTFFLVLELLAFYFFDSIIPL